jgi:hypothetical protein
VPGDVVSFRLSLEINFQLADARKGRKSSSPELEARKKTTEQSENQLPGNSKRYNKTCLKLYYKNPFNFYVFALLLRT